MANILPLGSQHNHPYTQTQAPTDKICTTKGPHILGPQGKENTNPQGHIEEAAVGMIMAISTPIMDHGHSLKYDHPTHSGPNRRPAQQDTSFLKELYCGI